MDGLVIQDAVDAQGIGSSAANADNCNTGKKAGDSPTRGRAENGGSDIFIVIGWSIVYEIAWARLSQRRMQHHRRHWADRARPISG